jgi:hypothetical protein
LHTKPHDAYRFDAIHLEVLAVRDAPPIPVDDE